MQMHSGGAASMVVTPAEASAFSRARAGRQCVEFYPLGCVRHWVPRHPGWPRCLWCLGSVPVSTQCLSRNRFKFDSLGVEASDVSGLRPRDSRARPGLLQKLPQSDSLCFEALDCV